MTPIFPILYPPLGNSISTFTLYFVSIKCYYFSLLYVSLTTILVTLNAWNEDPLDKCHYQPYELELISRMYCIGYLRTYPKVIHPKNYKHLKKAAHQSHLGRPKPFGKTKNGLVSGKLACTSNKTEI